MQPTFKDFPLELINPGFDSDLVDVLNELEILRHLQLRGDVHPHIFMQLKSIFHMLESIGSARIEGNHTTIADYVESKLDDSRRSEQLDEIQNIETAMQYIDEAVRQGSPITEHFIRELHTLTVKGLSIGQEGDRTPGQYRNHSVAIAQSAHLPPDAVYVPQYMAELVDFINRNDKPKYDLMKIALAHHRFGWIHPFGNGNGRTVRLLTYALLVKYGFNVQTGGRVLNPTAVFCNDRNRYYQMLAIADSGTAEGLEQWCTYVLSGISKELHKVDRLTDLTFLGSRILNPAIQYSLERRLITAQEAAVLTMAVQKAEIKAGDLKKLFPEFSAAQCTYQIKKLLNGKFIMPVSEGSRTYIPNWGQSYLIRGVIEALREQNFITGLD